MELFIEYFSLRIDVQNTIIYRIRQNTISDRILSFLFVHYDSPIWCIFESDSLCVFTYDCQQLAVEHRIVSTFGSDISHYTI